MASPTQHEFEQVPRDGEGQGSLVRFSPWGLKELDTTEQMHNKLVITGGGGWASSKIVVSAVWHLRVPVLEKSVPF